MGLFLKEDTGNVKLRNNIFNDLIYPKQLIYAEYMNKPHKCSGPKSGAYILASYLEAIYFQLNDKRTFSDIEIDEIIYDPIQEKHNGYITLQDGLKQLCSYIHDQMHVMNISEKNIIWFNDIDTCKRYIHRNNYIIVEMNADKALLNYSDHQQDSNFIIDESLGLATTSYTKGFMCCGYDNQGFVLMNSLGIGYGSGGYVKLTNEVFSQNLIKAATINNIFG